MTAAVADRGTDPIDKAILQKRLLHDGNTRFRSSLHNQRTRMARDENRRDQDAPLTQLRDRLEPIRAGQVVIDNEAGRYRSTALHRPSRSGPKTPRSRA